MSSTAEPQAVDIRDVVQTSVRASDLDVTIVEGPKARKWTSVVFDYVFMLLLCFVTFGTYYTNEMHVALQDIIEKNMHISPGEFMTFQAAYSWPSVAFCVLAGIAMDAFNPATVFIIVVLLAVCGGLLMAAGAFLGEVWIMLLSRVVYAMGGDTSLLALMAVGRRHISDSQMNLFFGLQMTISRLGSIANMNAQHAVYNYIGSTYFGDSLDSVESSRYACLGITFIIGTIPVMLSLGLTIIVKIIDSRKMRESSAATSEDVAVKRLPNSTINENLSESSRERSETVRSVDLLVNALESSRCEKTLAGAKRGIATLRRFPAAFWVICVINSLYYGVHFTYVNSAIVFFERKYHADPIEAAFTSSCVYFFAASVSPFIGVLMDRVGRNAYWGLLCLLLQFASMIFYSFTFFHPLVGTFVLGAAYSCVNAFWSGIGWLVPEKSYGVGMGLLLAFSNGGGASLALVSGAVLDAAGFWCTFVLLIGYDAYALVLCVALLICCVAQRNAILLNAPASLRAKLKVELIESK